VICDILPPPEIHIREPGEKKKRRDNSFSAHDYYSLADSIEAAEANRRTYKVRLLYDITTS
jgi:hypothetical protein